MNIKYIENLLNTILIKTDDINIIICELKKNNLSQGETHFILYRIFKSKYSFHEIGEKIINSDCWKDIIDENIAIENDINDFLDTNHKN